MFSASLLRKRSLGGAFGRILWVLALFVEGVAALKSFDLPQECLGELVPIQSPNSISGALEG